MGCKNKFPITFIYSGRTIDIDEGEYLLEAAEEAGIEMDSDCRNGSCGTCATIADGIVEWATDEHCLTEEQVESGLILSCICKIAGPLSVEE